MMKERIHTWLSKIEKDAVVPHEIKALNFGIYETERGYCVYLVGAREYEEDDDSWAEEVENVPCEFFIEIEMKCDWRVFQEKIRCILADEIKQRSTNLLSPFHNKTITTGFDDGNLTKISQ